MLPDLHIAAAFEDSNGYGSFTNNIIRWFIQQGVKVALTPVFGMLPPRDLLPYLTPRPPAKFDILFCSVSNLPTDINSKILFTMVEATKLPWEHGEGLKRFKHIITPTAYSAETIKPWNKRVSLCPLGVDMPWSPISFKPFTFTVVAADHLVPERKRVQEIVDTFSATFRTENDVRLQLKRSAEDKLDVTFDSRIDAVHARIDRPNYLALMAKTTVGVQASAMEGWSLPVNEFMAMGRPVICPRAGAMADYIDPAACFPVEYTMKTAPKLVYLSTGKVPYADMRQIGAQMRFAYENRFEVYRRGLKAYECAQKFTTHTMGKRFFDLCQTILT